jgi:hypothetical protein
MEKKVIYVNGYYHAAGKVFVGFLPANGGAHYWDYFDPAFIPASRKLISAASNSLNLFVDGSGAAWSSSKTRFNDGVKYAGAHYDELMAGMANGGLFEFVSHSHGGAFAAGMASYLQSRGQTIKSMLFLSPYQPEDIPTVTGTFSTGATFSNDKIANGKPIKGVNINMVLSSLNGVNKGILSAHGATVDAAVLEKISRILGRLELQVYGTIPAEKWAITEDRNGILTFTRIYEPEK